MDRRSLFSAILQDIHQRSPWETRQAIFYKMRHDGLRRISKPWPGAADLHYPLADTIINKLKPYYFEQLFATDTLATFVCDEPGHEADTTGIARWFDYKLKQGTNLETEILTVIDFMCQSGRSVCKVYWDAEYKRVAFDAAYPQNIIVPSYTKSLAHVDRITQVLPMSVAAYKANPNYNQAILDKIRGRKQPDDNDSGGLQQQKEVREGITGTTHDDELIVWEVYSKVNGKWAIQTFSPSSPDDDVRPVMELAYKELPFVDFAYEIKDKGWYDPRGIPELVAPFEASLSKMWNEKHDCLTLYNRPLFRTSQQLPNTLNLTFQPGQILPFDISPVQHQQPPMSFDQEMISTRQVAEQRVAMPDYGMNQVMNTRDRRTAHEISSINEVMGNATDLRMRIFRQSLGRLYRLAYSLLLQYDKSRDYLVDGQPKELTGDQLREGYHIMPTGSADGVSKTYNYQKAVSRFQMFNNDPFINQGELRKSILESDEVSLVRRLFTNPQSTAATQMEDQAQEISILNLGFPAVVQPTDDHAVHITTAAQYLQKQAQTGQPFDPMAHQRIMDHIGQHFQALASIDPKLAKQLQQELIQLHGPQGQPESPAQPTAQ
jgi:hypothetical protein